MIEATPGNEIPGLISDADKLFTSQKFDQALEKYEHLVGLIQLIQKF